MIGKVTEWKMTEEQRLAYIAKHPIKETKKPSGSSFAEKVDYRWRGSKGAAATKAAFEKNAQAK